MTRKAIAGARIFTGGLWSDDQALVINDTKIESLVKISDLPSDLPLHKLQGGSLLPGFIDVQVNGGGGVLFNDQTTVEGIAAIMAAHRKFGTTAMMPTLISDDLDVIAEAISAVDGAIKAGIPGVIGIHIEGPFLNASKNGIHDAKKFRTLDAEGVSLLSSLKQGRTLVTLAPERAPPGAIRALVKNGVIVAAGHTLATYEQMQLAIDEGLSGVTHLFNAMTQLESRAPGVVGASLDSDLFCGIIVDGHHVHPATLRAAFRAKGSKALMLVTDAMPIVGSEMTEFSVGGNHVFASDGMLRSANGTLAGSNLDMARAVRNSVDLLHVSLEEASCMASTTPASFLGINNTTGQIAPGFKADMVHFGEDLHVEHVWIAGDLI